jgi:VWFA-related protein
MRILLPVLVAVMGVGALASQRPSAPAQTQPPTFKGAVRVIEVDAIVRDRDDNFVPGLTKDDFVVFEDGRSQEIVSVSTLNLPVDRRGRPAEINLPAAAPVAGEPEDIGRVYVMILNSSHEQVRRIAHEFIDGYLGPTDLMSIMHGNRAGTQGLTNDKELLRAAVDRYSGGGANGVALIKEVSINLNALRGRRKAILYIGEDTGIARSERSLPEMAKYDDAVQTAIRNNVRIYPIDPRGFLVRIPLEERPLNGPAGTGLGEGMHARILASATGGTAVVNSSNFSGGFRRVVRDNSAYYVVAFYSSVEPDGKFHPVKIQVNRPDLSVRAQAGYRATTPDVKGRSVKLPSNLSANARDVLSGSAREDGLPVDLFTAVFQGEGYDGSLLIGCHLPGAQLKLDPNERIELSYVAVDRWGVTRAAERRAFTLTLSDSARAKVAETGLRLFGRLRLPRGHYDIRVAVHQPGGATGSAVAEVEIPDYTELPLSVSDLVVASSHGPTLTTLEDDTILRRALPTQPTPNRRFRRGETLTVFGEVYNSQWVLTPKVGVSNLVVSSAGRVVARAEETLVASNRGRVYYTGRVPLAGFDPGEYALTVEAFTRDGLPTSASQQLRFEVAD